MVEFGDFVGVETDDEGGDTERSDTSALCVFLGVVVFS